MTNLTRRIAFCLTLFLTLTGATLAKTSAFEEARRHGDDTPGGALRWEFQWNGKPVSISSDGKGTVGNREIQMPLNSTRLTARLFYATYDGDLLLLVEETDEESGAGKLARFASKTLKPKWTCGLPGINIGPALLEGKFAYLSARATAMKVDLANGQWAWRKTNLNRTNESTTYRFNAFDRPRVEDTSVIFPEAGASGSITFDKAKGEILEVK